MMIRNIIFAFLLIFVTGKALAIHPSATYLTTPTLNGTSNDSLNIQTSDNSRLTGWYCRPAHDSSQFLIVLAGGDAGNMSYDLPLAQFFIVNFHVPVLLFDYRGFGTSNAFKYDSNAIGHPEYLTDLDAAVSYASEHYSTRKIIVYGRSIGAALAIVEGAKRVGITGVIAESPYPSQASLTEHIQHLNPTANVTPIVSMSLEPIAWIQNFRTRNLLVLHGKSELAIPSDELEALVNASPSPNKKFLDFEDCNHLELPFKSTQKFGEAIAQFLAECQQ
jgi:alpha-beta hydrolase superfamily lysophospholipase